MPARQLEPRCAGTIHAAPAWFDCVYIGAKNRSSTVPAQLAFWCKRGIKLYSLVCGFKHYFEDNAVCDINLLNPSTHDSITLLLKFVYRNYIIKKCTQSS